MATGDTDITSRPILQDPSAPDARPPQTGSNTAAARDELDDLFNYDAQIDNVYRDVDQNTTANARGPDRATALDTGNGGGLGIDEEVKIRKPRAPTVKLDEDRLLSAKGIPKLRKITKDRLRFRGKGHEFSDVARLLNLYQLWLDDLFPKANFADGLSIIEKLGHKKRLQVMRKEWIQEDKPKASEDIQSEDNDFIDHNVDSIFNMDRDKDAPVTSIDVERNDGNQDEVRDRTMPLDAQEDLYGLPSPQVAATTLPTQGSNDEPEEDELDQLLAEDATRSTERQDVHSLPNASERHDYEDDEEVMAELGW